MANVITTVLKLDAAQLRTGLKSAQQTIKETDGFVNKAKTGFQSMWASFSSSPLAIAGATAAVGAFTAKAVNDASNLEESVNAVNVAYGNAADGVHALGASSAESFGLSERAFNEFSVQFSAFANKIAEAGGRDVVGVLDEMTTRIADFASVNNLDLAESARIVQSALAGETEAFRRFGGDVSAATVTQFALEHGLAETSSELTEQDKILARYQLIMEQTNKTAGDFANTSEGLANQQRILAANVEDLSASFGKSLTPIVADAVGTLNNLINVYEDLNRIGADAAPEGGGGPFSRIVDQWSASVAPGKAAAGAIDGVNRATAKLDSLLGRTPGELGTFNLAIRNLADSATGAAGPVDAFGNAIGETADEFVDLGDKAANAGPKIGDMAGALEDAREHLADLNEEARNNALDILATAAGAVGDALEGAFGEFDEDLGTLDALDSIKDQFDTIAEAQKEATDPAGIRKYNGEVRRGQRELADFVRELDGIEPEKRIEFLARIRTGDIETLKAVLEEATKDQFVNIIPIVAHDAFHSVNASFTPGSAPSAPTFSGVTAAPNQPVSTDARTIINYYPVGTTPTTQYQNEQTDLRRNGPR